MRAYVIIKISAFLIFCTLIRSLQLADQGQIIKQEHKNIKSKIYLGEEKQVIQLSEYGSVINQHLDDPQQVGDVTQCMALRQTVSFFKKEQLELIQDYTENQFRSHYKEGAFQGDIPRIISYSPVKYGAVILTSQGELFLVSLSQLIDGPDRIIDHIVLEQHLSFFRNNKKTYMVYFESKNELLISLSEVTIIIKIDKNKFQNFNNVITGIDQDQITYMQTIDDQLIISMGQQGFVIGPIEMNQNHSKFKALFYFNEVYAMYSKANKQKEGEYLLYILDFEQGVKVYNFKINIIEAQIIDIHLIDMSPMGGSGVTSFDVYGNSLLVVKKQNDYYKVTDYHTLIGLQQWTQLNEWIFESEIKSVNLSKDFAIILGQSGHHIVYHSINKNFYNDIDQRSQQPLYFPNLRAINFLERDDLNLIYGITRDKFFITQWELHPIQIICQSNSFQDAQSPILMTYHLNSTNCPNKIQKENDMQMCQTQIQLEATFIYPILDATKKDVLATSLIIIFSMFVLLLVFLMRKFLAFRGKANLISREINNYTHQGHILRNEELDYDNQSAPQYVLAQLDSNQTPNSENNLVPVEKEQI